MKLRLRPIESAVNPDIPEHWVPLEYSESSCIQLYLDPDDNRIHWHDTYTGKVK